MNLSRVLRRLRLELDQTLRTRAFVSRAVRGLLRPEEALDLIAQQAFMLWAVGGERSARLVEVAGRDARRLGGVGHLEPGPPSTVLILLNRFALGSMQELDPSRLYDVTVSVTGTSWVACAANHSPGSEFLSELSQAGHSSLQRLDDVQDTPSQAGPLSTFAELARGMVLGLSNHLDNAWPAQVHTHYPHADHLVSNPEVKAQETPQ